MAYGIFGGMHARMLRAIGQNRTRCVPASRRHIHENIHDYGACKQGMEQSVSQSIYHQINT